VGLFLGAFRTMVLGLRLIHEPPWHAPRAGPIYRHITFYWDRLLA